MWTDEQFVHEQIRHTQSIQRFYLAEVNIVPRYNTGNLQATKRPAMSNERERATKTKLFEMVAPSHSVADRQSPVARLLVL